MPSSARVWVYIPKKRGEFTVLDILFYLVMHHHKIVEVLDLGTLYHDGFTDVHVLCICPAYDKTAFKPPCCSCGVVDDVGLDYAHTESLPEL